MDMKRVTEIRSGLLAQKELVSKPKGILDVLSVILAFTPLSGVSAILDKVAGQLQPDLFKAVDELLVIVSALAPDIERIEDHEARLSALSAAVTHNQALASRLLAAAEKLPQELVQIETDGGHFTIRELILAETHLVSEATGGGLNQFGSIDLQNTPSTFKTGLGSKTEIGSLRASGTKPGVSYSISMPTGQTFSGEGSFQTAIYEAKPNGLFSFVGARSVKIFR